MYEHGFQIPVFQYIKLMNNNENNNPAEIVGSPWGISPEMTMWHNIVLIGETNGRFNLHGQPRNYSNEF